MHDAECEGVQFVHGSPLDEDIYITSEFGARAALEASPFHLTFFGHTHIQCAFARPRLVAEALAPERVRHRQPAADLAAEAESPMKYLVNPGSVGQPRDYDRRAAFAIYDSKKHEILFYRVPYDIAWRKSASCRQGCPEMLAVRLEDGR